MRARPLHIYFFIFIFLIFADQAHTSSNTQDVCRDGLCKPIYACRNHSNAYLNISRHKFEELVTKGLRSALPKLEDLIRKRPTYIEVKPGVDSEGHYRPELCSPTHIKKMKADQKNAEQNIYSYIRQKIDKKVEPLIAARERELAPYRAEAEKMWDEHSKYFFARASAEKSTLENSSQYAALIQEISAKETIFSDLNKRINEIKNDLKKCTGLVYKLPLLNILKNNIVICQHQNSYRQQLAQLQKTVAQVNGTLSELKKQKELLAIEYNKKIENELAAAEKAALANYYNARDKETAVMSKWADKIQKRRNELEAAMLVNDPHVLSMQQQLNSLPSLWATCPGLPKLILATPVGWGEMTDPEPGHTQIHIDYNIQFIPDTLTVSCRAEDGVCQVQVDVAQANVNGTYQFQSLTTQPQTSLNFSFGFATTNRSTYSFAIDIAHGFKIIDDSVQIDAHDQTFTLNLPHEKNLSSSNLSPLFIEQLNNISQLSTDEFASIINLVFKRSLFFSPLLESRMNETIPPFINQLTSGQFELPDPQDALIANNKLRSVLATDQINDALSISYKRTNESYEQNNYAFQFALCSQRPEFDELRVESHKSPPLPKPCSQNYDFSVQMPIADLNLYLQQLHDLGVFRNLCARYSSTRKICDIYINLIHAPQFLIEQNQLILRLNEFEIRGDAFKFPILSVLARLDSVRNVDILIPPLRNRQNAYTDQQWVKMSRVDDEHKVQIVREIITTLFGNLFSNTIFDYAIDMLDGPFGFFVGNLAKRFMRLFSDNQIAAGLKTGVNLATDTHLAYVKEVRATDDGFINIFADFSKKPEAVQEQYCPTTPAK